MLTGDTMAGLFVGTLVGSPGRYKHTEIIACSTAHDATTRETVAKYLAQRYGVTLI
jgi:hypothetical protein